MDILGLIPKNTHIHPLAECQRNRLLIFVPKSTSPNMPLAINMLEQAEEFEIIKIGKKNIYIGAFGLTLSQISLVLAIVDIASNWKGFSMFFNQQNLRYNGWFWHTLNCYQQALQCNDPKAHCNIIEKRQAMQITVVINICPSNQPKEPTHSKSYLIPCRQLRGDIYRLDSNHPSNFKNLLQAKAVAKNCHWCPFLNLDDYCEIDTIKDR